MLNTGLYSDKCSSVEILHKYNIILEGLKSIIGNLEKFNFIFL